MKVLRKGKYCGSISYHRNKLVQGDFIIHNWVSVQICASFHSNSSPSKHNNGAGLRIQIYWKSGKLALVSRRWSWKGVNRWERLNIGWNEEWIAVPLKVTPKRALPPRWRTCSWAIEIAPCLPCSNWTLSIFNCCSASIWMGQDSSRILWRHKKGQQKNKIRIPGFYVFYNTY